MGLDSLHFALATPEFWRARQLTLPFIRAATSITVPFYLLQFRNFAWDEWILKKIDQYQNVSSKYREVSGSSRSRSVVGGKFSKSFKEQRGYLIQFQVLPCLLLPMLSEGSFILIILPSNDGYLVAVHIS